VDAYNSRKLMALSDKLHRIPTGFSGDSMYWKPLASSMQIPELLEIKTGAMVMMLRNDMEGRYFNGSLGIVDDIEEGAVTVELLSGDVVNIGHANFDYYDEKGHILATATNFPLKLAWASTIHKAQGISVDRIAVSLSSLWEAGQAYVALSRARSLDGLYIEAWDERSIIADSSVMEFYQQLGKTQK
jgi:ATP-dependent exoDNAse (exonuclease V) alpha subunit